MKYFLTTDEALLDSLNAVPNASGGTRQWCAKHKHPAREEWSLEIQEAGESEDQLTKVPALLASRGYNAGQIQAMLTGLKTREQMEADGWFPVLNLQ